MSLIKSVFSFTWNKIKRSSDCIYCEGYVVFGQSDFGSIVIDDVVECVHTQLKSGQFWIGTCMKYSAGYL